MHQGRPRSVNTKQHDYHLAGIAPNVYSHDFSSANSHEDLDRIVYSPRSRVVASYPQKPTGRHKNNPSRGRRRSPPATTKHKAKVAAASRTKSKDFKMRRTQKAPFLSGTTHRTLTNNNGYDNRGNFSLPPRQNNHEASEYTQPSYLYRPDHVASNASSSIVAPIPVDSTNAFNSLHGQQARYFSPPFYANNQDNRYDSNQPQTAFDPSVGATPRTPAMSYPTSYHQGGSYCQDQQPSSHSSSAGENVVPVNPSQVPVQSNLEPQTQYHHNHPHDHHHQKTKQRHAIDESFITSSVVARPTVYTVSSPVFCDNTPQADFSRSETEVAGNDTTVHPVLNPVPSTRTTITEDDISKIQKYLEMVSMKEAMKKALAKNRRLVRNKVTTISSSNDYETNGSAVVCSARQRDAGEMTLQSRGNISSSSNSTRTTTDHRLEYDPRQPQYSPLYDPDPFRDEREYSPYFPGWYE